MKTCLLVPIKDRAEILPVLLKSIDALNPQPDKIIFLENNSTDSTLNILVEYCQTKPLQTQLIRIHVTENANEASPYTVIAQVRDILLSAARNFDADYAIFIESDIIPLSVDLIILLTKWEKPIVGCTYMQSKEIPNQIKRDAIYECDALGTACLCLSKIALQNKKLRFYPLLYHYGDENYSREDYGFGIKARELAFKLWWYPNINFEFIEAKNERPWEKSIIIP